MTTKSLLRKKALQPEFFPKLQSFFDIRFIILLRKY